MNDHITAVRKKKQRENLYKQIPRSSFTLSGAYELEAIQGHR